MLKDAESRGGEVNQDAVVRDNKRGFFGPWFRTAGPDDAQRSGLRNSE